MTTSDLWFSGGSHNQPLLIVRRANAKGMRLSIDPRDASVRLSLPMRAPLQPAMAWAAEKRAWVETELAKMPQPQPIVPGMQLVVSGQQIVVDWSAAYPRAPILSDAILTVGGPIDQLPQRVLRALRQLALDVLTRETFALAGTHGIAVKKVGVGDPRSRWGSCTSSGDIRYSWRLILAPSHVRLATVAHEVAHCIHLDHSAAFHALVAKLHGADPGPARRWLRMHGTALHWVGRGEA